MTALTIDVERSIVLLRSDISGLAALLKSQNLAESNAFTAFTSAGSQVSPVNSVVDGMESGYALLKNEAVTGDNKSELALLVGACAYQVSINGFHVQGQNGRALAIYNACRHALGEDVSETDPEISDEFKV